MMTIQDLAKKVKMKPAVVRARLRRELKHDKGARWQINGHQLPKAIRILQSK